MIRPIPNVLSIAGSDPSGGAGIQADLKTFAALGCHGMAAITALTAQNTRGVSEIHVPPATFVSAQIDMIFADIEVAAIKIGMLAKAEIVTVVADALRRHAGASRPIVVDPVLVATTGAALGEPGVVEAMHKHLFPLATVVTPNLDEAGQLAGVSTPASRLDVEGVARRLQAAASTAWLLKGGHGDAPTADDLLLVDGQPHWVSSPRIDTANTHGTGCTLSSAIAAFLALGLDLRTAVTEAKKYVTDALKSADRLDVGRGAGPVDHFARGR